MKIQTAFIALFAALIVITRFIAIPMGPFGIPITLQNMMAVLAGAIMGVSGSAAVALFIVAGIIGFPVFSSGQAGIAALLSPTGGFILGFFVASLITGLLLGSPKVSQKNTLFIYIKVIVSIVIGFTIIYILGVLRLAQIISLSKSLTFAQSLKPALATGLIPFIAGDILKIIIAILITLRLRPIAAHYIGRGK
jgi:biotin transport system substrate-specific component